MDISDLRQKVTMYLLVMLSLSVSTTILGVLSRPIFLVGAGAVITTVVASVVFFIYDKLVLCKKESKKWSSSEND